jgi:hypothetical protein
MRLQNKGRNNVPPGEEGRGDVLHHGCSYETRAGKTYVLEVELEGNVSDYSCNYKTRAGVTYGLEMERYIW